MSFDHEICVILAANVGWRNVCTKVKMWYPCKEERNNLRKWQVVSNGHWTLVTTAHRLVTYTVRGQSQ